MPEEITLKTIVDHIQAQGMEFRGEFRSVHERLDGLSTKIDNLRDTVERNHRNLTAQIDAIDKRLDAIEIENVPQRVATLERSVAALTAA